MKASCTILPVLLVLLPAAAAEIFNQRARPGETVTLGCEASSSFIRAVEWTRTDLNKDEYVLFYRSKRSDPTFQHLSFKGRVQLVLRKLKYGDVSLLLKNVNDNDAGTYECRVVLGGSRRNKRAIIKEKPIKTIQLTVKDTSSPEGNPESGNHKSENQESGNPESGNLPLALWLIVAVVSVAALVVCITGLILWRHKRAAAEKSKPPAAASETVEILLV